MKNYKSWRLVIILKNQYIVKKEFSGNIFNLLNEKKIGFKKFLKVFMLYIIIIFIGNTIIVYSTSFYTSLYFFYLYFFDL